MRTICKTPTGFFFMIGRKINLSILYTALALDNKPKRVHDTHYSIGGQKIVAVQTDITAKDWEKIFNPQPL